MDEDDNGKLRLEKVEKQVIFIHFEVETAAALHIFKWINPCAADLFVSISHAFETGIAVTISSLMKKHFHLWKIDISQTELLD